MEKIKEIEFYKVQASGNDFILLDRRKKPKLNYKRFAVDLCRRKLGIGADGVLAIEPSKRGEFKMRIFNADGSEAEMCGNGARCVGLWARLIGTPQKKGMVNFDTMAGPLAAKISNLKKNSGKVSLKMMDPFKIQLDISLKVLGRDLKVNFVNTGVPHAVVFVEGLDKIDVAGIGRAIRFYPRFKPAGTNVDFVEVKGPNYISLRTYERGVEAETLACGTGTVASAIIAALKLEAPTLKNKVRALTKGGQELVVYFNRDKDKISNVWLEGKADLVYRGKINGGKVC